MATHQTLTSMKRTAEVLGEAWENYTSLEYNEYMKDDLIDKGDLTDISVIGPNDNKIEDAESHGPYDVSILGGDREHVDYLLSCRDEWDHDLVTELIRWGARPPLLTVDDEIEYAHYTMLVCTFAHPNGARVSGIRLERGFAKNIYSSWFMSHRDVYPMA